MHRKHREWLFSYNQVWRHRLRHIIARNLSINTVLTSLSLELLLQKECFIFRPFIKIHGQLLCLRFASNTQFMYICELMMTELSQFVIIMDSKYSEVGINTLACRLCSKWCQTFGGRCNRASRQINSFKRFSKYLRIDRRLSVYKSFIQSNFSYCPVAWLFCGRKNSNKLEKLQERALRIVFDDFSSSYEFLCERANTLPLSFYRLRFLGIEMNKCIKETNPTYLNDLFCEQTSDYQLRDSSRLIQPKFNTFKFGFKSFRYFGAKLMFYLLIWNNRTVYSFLKPEWRNGVTAMLLRHWKRKCFDCLTILFLLYI